MFMRISLKVCSPCGTTRTLLKKGAGTPGTVPRIPTANQCARQHVIRGRSAGAMAAPGIGNYPLGRFIPLAEEMHLIGPIGEWVLEQACRQLTAWDAARLPPLSVAVNLSALQFHGKTLLEQVKKHSRNSRSRRSA